MGYFDKTQFDSIYDLTEAVSTVVERNITELMEEVLPIQLGLDSRSAYRLYVNDECIAVRNSERRTLDYYGGFEYVDSDYVQQLGDYTFYFAEDERVQEHIERFQEEEGLIEDEA